MFLADDFLCRFYWGYLHIFRSISGPFNWCFKFREQFFTFFYINRRKYWFRPNFRIPVFDGLTRFGMSWSRFEYIWKMSVCPSVCLCVCDKKFVPSVARELIHQNFMKLYHSFTPVICLLLGALCVNSFFRNSVIRWYWTRAV